MIFAGALGCSREEAVQRVVVSSAPDGSVPAACEDGAAGYCAVVFAQHDSRNCYLTTPRCDADQCGVCGEGARTLRGSEFDATPEPETCDVLERGGGYEELDCAAELRVDPQRCSRDPGRTLCDACCNPCNAYFCSASSWRRGDADPADLTLATKAVSFHSDTDGSLVRVPGSEPPVTLWNLQDACPYEYAASVVWDYLYFDVTTPRDSAVEIRVRTADTVELLETAEWSRVVIASASTTQVCLPPDCAVDAYAVLGGFRKPYALQLQLETRLVPSSAGDLPTINALHVQYTCVPEG